MADVRIGCDVRRIGEDLALRGRLRFTKVCCFRLLKLDFQPLESQTNVKLLSNYA